MKPPNVGLHFEEAYTLSVRFPLVFGSIIGWDVQDGCFMIYYNRESAVTIPM